MQKRWQLIEHPPCLGAIRISDAGNDGPVNDVNGVYCPVEERNGKKAWERPGPYYGELFWESSGTPQWMLRVSGLWVYSNLNGLTKPDPDTWVPEFAPPDLPPVITVVEDTVIRDLTPTGGGKFTRERDLSNGCIGYRRKLASELTFTGDDYKFFLTYEKSRTRRCYEFTIRRQWKCAGRWRTFWTGTFSTGAGKWDRTGCTFKVKPEVLDKYSCILKKLEKKVNALQVAPVDASAIVIPSLELAVCTIGLPVWCTDVYDIDGTTPINEYEFANSQSVAYTCGGAGSYTAYTLWRERQQTFCVAGTAVPPPGVGWVLLTDNCATDGTAVYVRNSTIPWTFGDLTMVETMSASMPPNPDSSCAWTYVGAIFVENEVNPFCFGVYHHFFVCYSSGTPTEFSRARPLMEVTEYMLDETGCDYTALISDFFEHNPPGDAPSYTAGINYVTNEANEVDALVILQNTDAIDPAASNPATLGELTLKDLLAFFSTAFQVFWDIDADGNFRLEHWIYWSYPVGLDLSDYTDAEKVEYMTYNHLNQDIPRYERARYATALNTDFVGADIEYDGPCVTTETRGEVKEYGFGPFLSDVAYVIADPDAIPKQGFTILATAFDGSTYNTLIGTGALSGNLVTNAALSVANLQANYWTWNRYQFDATMNKQEVTFDDIQTNVEQKDVMVKMCCAVLDFEPSNRVLTAMGKLLGTVGNPRSAYVHREEVTEGDGMARFTLRYAY